MSNVDPVQAAIQAAIAKAASQTNQGEAKGGGDYEPPKAGLTIVTLIGYVEIGVQKHDIPNKPSYESNDVQLIFELNGGANKAEVVDGKLIAKRLSVTEKLSQNEKANYFKIFNQLNYDGQATHGAQLLGRHFLAEVFVEKGKNGQTYASLKGPNGYAFKAPIVFKGDPLDPESQTKHPVPAPARAQAENKVFLWDYASKEMWDALYIDGEYEARKDPKTGVEYPAKSKNVLQNKIKEAINFQGSPIQKILGEEALSLADSPLNADPTQVVAGTAGTQTETESAQDAVETGDIPFDGGTIPGAETQADEDPLAGLVS